MIYGFLKNIITNKDYEGVNADEKENMNDKLDVFFALDRITSDQYQELHGLVNAVVTE